MPYAVMTKGSSTMSQTASANGKSHAERVADAVRATLTPRERERWLAAADQVIEHRWEVLEALARR